LKLLKDDIIEIHSQFKNYSKPELFFLRYWYKTGLEEIDKMLEDKK